MILEDKTVLVTGGTAGIGRETARLMKAKGAQVTLTGRDHDRLAAMQDEGFAVIVADLSSADGVDRLLAEWGQKRLDILVNNAGQLVDYDFRESAPKSDDVDACIYANLNAPIRLITGLMAQLQASQQAEIVNVTSALAIAPTARMPVYCASKAALRSFSLGLREQLRSTNVRVVEVLPPLVATQMNDHLSNKMMLPGECARKIVAGIERDCDEINVGATNLLRLAEHVSPVLARKLTIDF